MYKIVRKKELNSAVTLMEIEAPFIARKAKAGQFIIFRVDDKGERVPLTIAGYDREKGTVSIIFQKVGFATIALGNLNEGDYIQDFVGPLGKPTDVEGKKKVCVVGGGVGCAIALPSAKAFKEAGAEVTVIVGFRSKDIVILEDEFKAAAVVSHQDEAVGNSLELILQNHNILAAEAHNNRDFSTGFLESLGRGQCNGAAHTAADNADFLFAFHIGCLAKRADEVLDVISLIEGAQSDGCKTNLLENNGDCTLFPVIAGDGERDTLTLVVYTEDDKLACLCLSGNEGGLNLHQSNSGIQLFFSDNFIHNLILPLRFISLCF